MLNHRKFHAPHEVRPTYSDFVFVEKKDGKGNLVSLVERRSASFVQNAGITFRDFSVTNLQKLGVTMFEVNPHFIKEDSSVVSNNAEYLNSDVLLNELNDSINSDSNNSSETINFN